MQGIELLLLEEGIYLNMYLTMLFYFDFSSSSLRLIFLFVDLLLLDDGFYSEEKLFLFIVIIPSSFSSFKSYRIFLCLY